MAKKFHRAASSTPKVMSRDRLFQIDEYDLSLGRIKVTEVDSGKKFEVSIHPSTAMMGADSDIGSVWRGNRIDERMASQVPVGARIVLESASAEKGITVDGIKVGHLMAKWIVKVPEAVLDRAGQEELVRLIQSAYPHPQDAGAVADLATGEAAGRNRGFGGYLSEKRAEKAAALGVKPDTPDPGSPKG